MNSFSELTKIRFANGYNCAQAVSSPFYEKYGIEESLALRLTTGMGGGYRMGELCGAAAGGVFVISIGTKDPSIIGEKTKEFLERFEQVEGALNCRDILHATPEERSAKSEKDREKDRALCRNLCGVAVEILEDMGY